MWYNKACFGRRCVGKTYLVKELFSRDITFYFSGSIGKNITNTYQLNRFDDAIAESGGEAKPASGNWAAAFGKLRLLLKAHSEKRQVIFIDNIVDCKKPV